MKKKSLFNLIALIVSIVAVFPVSMFAGFYGYDNSATFIEKSFADSFKTSKLIAQSIWTDEPKDLDYWSALSDEIDTEFQNTVSRVVKNEETAILPSEEHPLPITIASATPSESDKIYAENHLLLMYGESWNSLNEKGTYISYELATKLIETGVYGDISQRHLLGETVILKSGSHALLMTIGGIFFSEEDSVSKYYSECLEDEIVYISLENTFELDTSSTKGFVTYEEGSSDNTEVYRRITGDISINENYIHSESMRTYIRDIESYAALNSKTWLCLLFSVMTIVLSIVFLLFSKRAFLEIGEIKSDSSRFLEWLQKKNNFFLALLTVGVAIACILIGIGRTVFFSFGTITLPFITPGSMCGVSLVVLVNYAVLWLFLRSADVINDSLFAERGKTEELVIVNTRKMKI